MRMWLAHIIVKMLLCTPKFKGRDALIARVPKWLLPTPTGPQIVPTQFGMKFHVDPVHDKGIEEFLYYRGTYEHGTLLIIDAFLLPGEVFVDVGANIGLMTVLAGKRVGPEGRVHAFEPVPSTIDILHSNVELNGLDNVEIHPIALGSEDAESGIYEEKGNRGGASLRPFSDDQQPAAVVKIRRLDDIIKPGSIEMIKIDVEGWEFEVMNGAREIFNHEKKPALIIEYSSQRELKGGAPLELFDRLRGLGYKIFKLKHGKQVASALREIRSQNDFPDHDNLFCFTEEHLGKIRTNIPV